eukprot:scaffold6483_cov101-Isochrysis_galbana.AAC.1
MKVAAQSMLKSTAPIRYSVVPQKPARVAPEQPKNRRVSLPTLITCAPEAEMGLGGQARRGRVVVRIGGWRWSAASERERGGKAAASRRRRHLVVSEVGTRRVRDRSSEVGVADEGLLPPLGMRMEGSRGRADDEEDRPLHEEDAHPKRNGVAEDPLRSVIVGSLQVDEHVARGASGPDQVVKSPGAGHRLRQRRQALNRGSGSRPTVKNARAAGSC